MVEGGVGPRDVDVLWRRSVECVDRLDRAGARLMRRAIELEFPSSVGLRVDPAAFGLVVDAYGYLGHQDFSVQVATAEGVAAAAALSVAATRFLSVGWDGQEYLTDEEGRAAESADTESRFYTPNFVSAVQPHPDGPWLWLDCKDGAMPLMARTMIRILLQELRRAGVAEGVIRPAPRGSGRWGA
ncbi:hypothetical protein MRQ36_30255 [Micromonospora sp. R77]|uniref:hypothetical protein n=1 Tax=Micromonospora sp. R77 TaxID=2925836 RepID=UPI001F619985|nr:hypothetical protein [Micromonospora sp. R77]MCI4066610.1 hypothetical protein [Micromonospora sp. R77]